MKQIKTIDDVYCLLLEIEATFLLDLDIINLKISNMKKMTLLL